MTSGQAIRYWAPHALLPSGPARDVSFDIENGRFAKVTAATEPQGAQRLAGVALPGLANGHSHAFHRALRGRTHAGGGTFWSWREQMYAIAGRLDPDSYLALARALYAEMALAGITTVGEFHYLHHAPGGARYAEPNAMAEALRQAAADAGVRLTLLDTCYLSGGLDADGYQPLSMNQLRFSDGDVQGWATRVAALRPSAGMRVGAAVHSVRAVPAADLASVAELDPAAPLHAHLSEQPAENAGCLAFHGLTPTGLLDAYGVLGPRTTVVHATHLSESDIATLGRAAGTACFCPTTERDLADGVGPARQLLDAGVRLSLGSDQHGIVDLLQEASALEMDERLASRRRGRFSPAQLLAALTDHASLGWDDAGRLTVGARADLVLVRLDSPRTSGSCPEQVMLSASAADISMVISDGRVLVRDGQHVLGDVGRLLDDAITPLWALS